MGLIWLLTPTCEAALDGYEGVEFGVYHKAEIAAGESLALVYLAAASDPGHPQPQYLEGIIEAATALNFHADYLRELATWGICGSRARLQPP